MFVVESWAESHPYGPHDQTITTSAPLNMEAMLPGMRRIV